MPSEHGRALRCVCVGGGGGGGALIAAAQVVGGDGSPLGSCACAVWRGRKACRRCDASAARLLAARVRSPIFVRCLSRCRPPPRRVSLSPGVLRGVGGALPVECLLVSLFSRSSDSDSPHSANHACVSKDPLQRPYSVPGSFTEAMLTAVRLALALGDGGLGTAAPQIDPHPPGREEGGSGPSLRTPCLRSARRHAAAHAGLQRAS
eukprot:COSAG03_NODE_121_length_12310_cov_7.452870_7_plen_206_part_00